MPESLAAVGAYFGASGAAELGVAGGSAIAGGTTFEAGAAAVTAAEAGGGAVAGGFGGVTGTTVAAGGGGYLGAVGKAAAGAAASSAATQLLAPKPPKVPGATPMPDPQATEEARKRSIAEQMARRGRASTILTDPVSGTLGG